MQPTYSADGRYWWDGRAWQRVPGAPEHGAPPPAGPPGWAPPPGSPPAARLPLIIAGIVALILVIIAVPAVYFLTRAGGPVAGPAPAGSEPAGPVLQPGDEVTKEKLSRVSAADFYWAALDRQLTAPVSVINGGYFQTPADFAKHGFYEVRQVGVDHRSGADVNSKEFTAAATTYVNGKPDAQSRCVDGHHYLLLDDLDSRKPYWKKSDSTPCRLDYQSWTLGSSDGILPSGLKPDQASVVIKALRDDYPGFVNAGQPTLITASGHTYIRQIVDFKPVKIPDLGYWGTQIFLWAFKRTGLDSQQWPFLPGLGAREGLHVAYYYDVKTLLPAASVIRSTPVLDDDGQVKERYDQTQIFNYRFPAKLTPLTLKDTKPQTLVIPEGWKIPE
ncbi:hypothetical protein [Microlunatus speluncae]|uniref:hypothetical protein n=1 Tax=Microlunatus speluncae TaxID=2594267 RepID=UPI0012665F63|nr:hypothetical protein [Microlunatus speluncae]